MNSLYATTQITLTKCVEKHGCERPVACIFLPFIFSTEYELVLKRQNVS